MWIILFIIFIILTFIDLIANSTYLKKYTKIGLIINKSEIIVKEDDAKSIIEQLHRFLSEKMTGHYNDSELFMRTHIAQLLFMPFFPAHKIWINRANNTLSIITACYNTTILMHLLVIGCLAIFSDKIDLFGIIMVFIIFSLTISSNIYFSRKRIKDIQKYINNLDLKED